MTLVYILAALAFCISLVMFTPRSVPTRIPASGSSLFPRILRAVSVGIWTAASVVIAQNVSSSVGISASQETMYVLDISYSMLAEDLPPSRLAFIQDALSRDLMSVPDGRFGAVLFAGKPFLLSRTTDDREHLSRLIASASTDSINQQLPDMAWTNLWDGLLLAEKWFSDSALSRRIILITDGEANQGTEPTDVAKYLCQKGIVLTVIGIGSSDGVPLVTTDSFGRKRPFVEKGEPIITRLDTELLSRVSSECQSSFTQISRSSDGSLLRDALASAQTLLLPTPWLPNSSTMLLFTLISVALSLEIFGFMIYRLW